MRVANIGSLFVLSPNEQSLVYQAQSQTQARGGTDIWTVDLNRGTMSRLTFGGEPPRTPIWSANGRRVAFVRTAGVFEKDASGAGDERMLFPGPADSLTDWSPDGRHMLITEAQRSLMVTLGSGARVPVVCQRARQTWGDSHLMASTSRTCPVSQVAPKSTCGPRLPPSAGGRSLSTAGNNLRGGATAKSCSFKRRTVNWSSSTWTHARRSQGEAPGPPRDATTRKLCGQRRRAALPVQRPRRVRDERTDRRRPELAPAVTAGREMTSVRLLVFEDEQLPIHQEREKDAEEDDI